MHKETKWKTANSGTIIFLSYCHERDDHEPVLTSHGDTPSQKSASSWLEVAACDGMHCMTHGDVKHILLETHVLSACFRYTRSYRWVEAVLLSWRELWSPSN